MRILEVNTEKLWRGGERQTLYLIEGLRDAGVSVELLCLHGYPLHKKAISLGIPIHAVRNKFEVGFFMFSHRSRFDILHVEDASAQALAIAAKPFSRLPVVYTRRVDFVPKGMLTRLKYQATDSVIAISSRIQDILTEFRISNVDIITDIAVPQNLNTKRSSELSDSLGINGKKIIATTSALVEHKDVSTMLKAIMLLSEMRDDFVFLHFGDGVQKAEVENSIKSNGMNAIYKLLGFYDNVEDFFSIFDVFVMSSKEEGLGSSVLDAFTYKVPVVSTNAGGLKAAVSGHGMVCNVGDYKCLANSINSLLEDEALRDDFVQKAFKYVNESHGRDEIISSYIKSFKSHLNGSGS